MTCAEAVPQSDIETARTTVDRENFWLVKLSIELLLTNRKHTSLRTYHIEIAPIHVQYVPKARNFPR